jgi:hypothetical protein
MAATTVPERAILDALHKVPPQRWGEMLTFLQSLQAGGPEPAPEKKATLTAADLLQSGLVGMWADRTDIGDTREFARRLRARAQTRRRDV